MKRNQLVTVASLFILLAGTVSYKVLKVSIDKTLLLNSDRGKDIVDNKGIDRALELYTTDSQTEIPILPVRGTFLTPKSFREMAESSDVIVIGKPSESIEESEVRLSTSESDGSFDSAFSITEFVVETALKGDFQSGEVISIGQSVAILSEGEISSSNSEDSSELYLVSLTKENYRPIRKGATYILFLKQGLDQGSDVYFPAGNVAGRVNVDGTDELTDEVLLDRKIRQYAREVYRQTVENRGRNPIASVVDESDRDFPIPPAGIDNPGLNRLPDNVPNVDVQPGRQRTRTLPPASQRRNERSIDNPGSPMRTEPPGRER